MLKTVKQNQKGAVSMLTVIFIAIILTVITTSFIRLSINEQRESTDDDLTTRAYYAAESGVQDAITAIKSGTVNNKDNCTPSSGDGVLSGETDLDTAYTCQLINETPKDYQADLEEGESRFFKVESGTPVQSIKISWHIKGPESSGGDGDNIALRNSASPLPQKNSWNNGAQTYPAMIRLQLIEIPNTGVNRTNIAQSVGHLNPSTTPSATTTFNALDGGVSDSACSAAVPQGAYVCEKTVTGLSDSTHDYYLRIQAIYTGTHIKVEAQDLSGQAVAILNAQAVIDVTGRAADVYRRVEERVSLIPDSLWPNYAILTAEDLCKDFLITDDVGEFNANNGFTPGNGTSCQP